MADGGHILFFNYPAHGHFNPSLPVVAELVRRGHQVTYAVTKPYADAVAATGATVLLYQSEAPESWEDTPIPEEPTGDDAAVAILFQLLEGFAPLAAAEEHFGAQRPDLVVYDQYAHHTGRLLAKKWGRPGVMTCTTFAANAGYSPYAKLAETSTIVIDPAHPAFARLATTYAETMAAQGFPELSMEEFNVTGPDSTIVFVPRQFQLGAETFDETFHFVGSSLGDGVRDGRWTPPGDGKPVLLITMGSHGYENRTQFYRNCVQAFTDQPWHVVMAIGTQVKPEELAPLPDNFEVHSWVPQLSVLEHASGFLAHAGMGSTLESLYHGVAPVVVPRLGEQHLVADRLVELGLGRKVLPTEATPEALREAVNGLAADEQAQAAVRKMQQHLRDSGGTKAAADAIEAKL
ncbi:macrolide family glycosyltransferase [Kutzneria albida]|uniref:Glycosyltransferase n=1 Tax=Kutzneria albida DSM 43870 TaxID=1449976 RepID=W5WP26_9PSEU|nr:macrolide family glycosyltransferase [Kutzneria albida]AHH99929.1 glycosyltransferase [Kutzneria albida DSM 43870]